MDVTCHASPSDVIGVEIMLGNTVQSVLDAYR